MDYFAWENEKKDAIIEMKDNEIESLKSSLELVRGEKEKTELGVILEKFAKRNENLEKENQELAGQLAEMKLKIKEMEMERRAEAKIEVLPKSNTSLK